MENWTICMHERQRSYVMSVSGGSKMQMGSLQSFPSGNAQETSRFDLKRAINISDFGKGVKNALRVFSKYVQHDEYNRLEEGLILEQNLRSRILELKDCGEMSGGCSHRILSSVGRLLQEYERTRQTRMLLACFWMQQTDEEDITCLAVLPIKIYIIGILLCF
eukprot:TRINITY_DN38769_c0_g1_i16.p3 TRINITY_DN38769_c0_g1~~TRINITY_DN38769_c0_g1_i16.p3  ORF type:complete len:163 (-),score=8.59 TRINITY_DN38769_c0_g1_i16:242-730(-)